jgi:hypothetical protein
MIVLTSCGQSRMVFTPGVRLAWNS